MTTNEWWQIMVSEYIIPHFKYIKRPDIFSSDIQEYRVHSAFATQMKFLKSLSKLKGACDKPALVLEGKCLPEVDLLIFWGEFWYHHIHFHGK